MNPGDAARVRQLFERVHDLTPAQRRAFLARECAETPGLLEEVEQLIAAAESSPALLEPVPGLGWTGALERPPEGELRPGAPVGGFRLVARIASGGMGTVWEAEQQSPRRRVALKVLRFTDASIETVRRFRHESEILARLRHAHVAQVFAAGMHTLTGGDSLPWYALEYVESARTLTDYAGKHALGLRARLQLFVQLCDAVQHGHERGVIHRDLKPSNVLVDGSGVLKVIDFGVARARWGEGDAASVLTEAGSVLGTLQYMAPEQLAGSSDDVDTRCDVYALGALFYELVTEALPYDLAGLPLAQAARVVAEHSPRRPGALRTGVPTEIDAIVLKALEKDRERRYESAAALAGDVRRHLSGEAVLARPPSSIYQLRVFARRHRAATVAALSIMLVSFAAAAVSLGFAWRAGRAEELATRRYEELRGLARSVLFDLHDSIELLPGATDARRKLADTALVYLDALERDGGDDAGLLEELAQGRMRLGLVLGAPANASLGDRAAGARELERALAASERLLAIRPDPAARLLHARILITLANSARAAGELARAEGLALQGEQEVLVAESGMPGDADALLLVSSARVQRAKILSRLGRSAEAAELLDVELERTQRMRCQWPDELPLFHAAFVPRLDLGILRSHAARPAEALALFEDALACAEEHYRRDPQDVQASEELALSLAWLGGERANAGEVQRALEDLERAAALQGELLRRDPSNSTALGDLSFTYSRLGRAHVAAGDLERAFEAHSESLALSRKALERSPQEFEGRLAVADGQQALFEILHALARMVEAREALARTLELLLALERDHPDSLEVARSLGTALMREGDEARREGMLAEAISSYDEAGRRFERAAAGDRMHAWSRRMVMVQRCWLGVAHMAGAERATGDERTEHYELAAEAFEAALDEGPPLERDGFLKPGDETAIARVREDLEKCRLALPATAP